MILGSLIDIDERAIALESRAFSKGGPKTSLIEIPDSSSQKILRWTLIIIGFILIIWRIL
jgi:energy-coupling factor transport system permease protein